jgi:hypothetical protein
MPRVYAVVRTPALVGGVPLNVDHVLFGRFRQPDR